MKKTLFIAILIVIAAALAGCGGDSDRHRLTTGPGLVGIEDIAVNTAPLLTVIYEVPPSTIRTTVEILSDFASDGDIEFNPVDNTFIVTPGPGIVLFGFDRFTTGIPEFRGFLTFPLDGITGQPVVPAGAQIVSATLEVFVDQVSFFDIVPTFLDLVQYPFRGLSAADFNSAPIAFRTLDFFWDDPGNFVAIDVTPLMQQTQAQAFTDFQVRFVVDSPGTLSPSRAPSVKANRSIRSAPRSMDNVVPNRGDSTAGPAGAPDPASRKR